MEVNPEGALDRVFSSQPKVRILRILLQNPATPRSLATALQISQGTASNHLAALHGFGVVESVVNGRRRLYSISSSKLAATLRTRFKPEGNHEQDIPTAGTSLSSACTCDITPETVIKAPSKADVPPETAFPQMLIPAFGARPRPRSVVGPALRRVPETNS
ncbi:winged helix-turn-helix domain-containing protein [Arthrobacter sp. FW306-04-A]|uniref:helix-turn-helix domain-containing protein n=1 Tax=Arthrobacter sp. FW306-04-A TaxID=2879619 RepID=UPI0037BEFC44|nr:helix-turn-helix domain-containing protein [Arthrobacter sp. FW306-04-A]